MTASIRKSPVLFKSFLVILSYSIYILRLTFSFSSFLSWPLRIVLWTPSTVSITIFFPPSVWLYYYYTLIRAFHISVSRWFFTGIWVTASLLKSLELFLVFWPFSIMLSFGWSPLVRQLPSPLVPLVTVPNAPITIGIIVTYMFHSFFNSLARSRYLSFFSHSFSFILWSAGTAKLTIL